MSRGANTFSDAGLRSPRHQMAGEILLTPLVSSEQGLSTLGILARSPSQRRQRLIRKACIPISHWILASHLLTNTGQAQAGTTVFEARIWTDLFFPRGTATIPIHLPLDLVQKIPLRIKRLSQKLKQTQGNSQLYWFFSKVPAWDRGYKVMAPLGLGLILVSPP